MPNYCKIKKSVNIIDEIEEYLIRLFPLCRSITGEPNRKTLKILQEIIPLTIHEVPSGSKVFDWIIPDEWKISSAWIEDQEGKRIVDFNDNNLHVVSYSMPINKTMHWQELKPHIHFHPSLPNAIPYRTSYFDQDWGFCVTNEQYEELSKNCTPLNVFIDSELKPGSLSYGEYLIKGHSSREVLLSCYICHPSMANDSLSGVLLTAFLARCISIQKNLNWSYRIVFVPETIGAVTYCALNQRQIKEIDIGLVITTVGGPGDFGYKQTWNPDHWLNELVESILEKNCNSFKKYPFDIHGSDERQYSSQGFRVNSATICKDKYYEYSEYHSSLDNLNFVSAKNIERSLNLYIDLIYRLESLEFYKSEQPNCENMLSKHNLYPALGGAQSFGKEAYSETDLVLWILFLSDGKTPLFKILKDLDISKSQLNYILQKLVDLGLLRKV